MKRRNDATEQRRTTVWTKFNISNSDFSNGLQSWSTQGNATYSSYFGVNSIAFSDANSVVDGVIYQDFLATKNELLTLNIEFSRRGTPIGRVGALIEVFDYIKLDTTF